MIDNSNYGEEFEEGEDFETGVGGGAEGWGEF